MRRPQLNALRTFDAAARTGNFRLAGEELHITQGAVAQQVRKLEVDLEVQLFHRLPRGVTLTEAGARYHGEVRKALALIDRATEALAPDRASITLSVPPSLASKWLVPRLAAFEKAFPDIALETRASEAITDFGKDSVDLAIRQGVKPPTGELLVQMLAPVDLCAIATSDYLSGKPMPQKASDFADHRLIEDGHRRWQQILSRAAVAVPSGMLAFNQTALAIDAARSGQGIAIAPRLLVSEALDCGALEAIWTPEKTEEAYFLLHPPTEHPARDRVVDWLRQQI